MSATDLARLAIAKRAYKATQPDDSEVQTGVRRARLWLRRPKTRRSWLSKGLVLVVVAVGGLAYAKPHALGDLVSDVLPHLRPSAKPVGKLGGVAPAEVLDVMATPAKVATRPRVAAEPKSVDVAAVQPEAARAPTEAAIAEETSLPAPATAAIESATKVAAKVSAARAAGSKTGTQIWRTVGSTDGALGSHAEQVSNSNGSGRLAGSGNFDNSDNSSNSNGSGNVSDWGRVGQALARRDENQALKALLELSASDDQSTRDKADLGRAQLLMANGNRDGACSLARALTHRRAGGRIERQARALLKSCSR